MSMALRVIGRRWIACFVVSAAALSGILVDPPSALGQDAEPDPAPTSDPPAPAAAATSAAPQFAALIVDDKLSRLESVTIRRLLQGTDPFKGPAVTKFDEFFRMNFFAKMTQPDQLNSLLEKRDDLDKHFQTARRNTDVMKHLNDLTYQVMYGICLGPRRALNAQGQGVTVIAIGPKLYALDGKPVPMDQVKRYAASKIDFHPAVKYNAMLIIGGLNDKQPSGNNAAVPHSNMLLPLLGVAESAKRKWPDPLRVAALIGLKRHSQVKDRPLRVKELIATGLLNVLNEKTPPGRSPQGDVWIRRQAVDILAELAIPGPDNNVVMSLDRVLTNDNAPLPLRTAAAEALGRIPLKGMPAGATKALAKGLGDLAVAACRHEISGGSERREPPSRARLVSNLNSVQSAINGPSTSEPGETGLAVAAQAADKVLVTRLAADIQRIVSVANKSSMPEEKLKAAIAGPVGQLTATLQGKPAGAAPAETGIPSPF